MMKLSDLTPATKVLATQLEDPAFRDEWERTALAREVALRVTQYRAEHGLSQAALARMLGMQQSAIARIEAGVHEPTISTLRHLAQTLDMEFHITITPNAAQSA